MRRHWIVRFFAIALIATIFVAGFGSAVMHLWNGLMPALFGLAAVSFWQAVGLLALSWLLFGSWRGLPRWRHRRGPWAGRGGMPMTAAQERQFREGLRSRCGRRDADPDAAGPAQQV